MVHPPPDPGSPRLDRPHAEAVEARGAAAAPVLPASPPPIGPLREAGRRPRFSVMVPTYEPDEKLRKTLESVLGQAPSREAMQIAVVDDGSPSGRVERLVTAVDRTGRIDIVAHDERLGLCGNWNRAISLAHGELVHLLHQDDYVLPGFYERLDRGFRSDPRVGMAFCCSRIIDGEDRVQKTTSRLRLFAGVMSGWVETIATRQRVQAPAVVVARRTYEAIGGYRPELCQTLDWEMWVRIAGHTAVWHEPRPLAAYRRHANNETSRLAGAGLAWPDVVRAIAVNSLVLPPATRDRTTAASIRWHAGSALRSAERLLAEGAVAQATATLDAVPMLLGMLPAPTAEAGIRRRLSRLRQRADRLQDVA